MNNKIVDNNSATIWISGVTASGKTTLGKLLYKDLIDYGIKNVKFLDGDDLRNKQPNIYGYSAEDRFRLIKKYVKIVDKENKNGNIVIIPTVSHQKRSREFARNHLNNFFEINLVCSVEECSKRDFKNIYNSISKEKDQCIPGLTEPYEIFKKAELIINTEENEIRESQLIIFNRIKDFLESSRLL